MKTASPTRRIALATLVGAAAALAGCGNDAAPLSTFVLLDGSSQTTQDLKGKVTLVNFWATSCTTCVAEMPQIISTYDKYKTQGFDTIAVAMQYDPLNLTPTTYIVDKQGQIVKKYVGAPNFAELHQLIEKLLAA